MQEYITTDETETMELGQKMAGRLKKGDVLALIGDLGTGKTAFVKGLARGLSIHEPITSPTFTLVHSYESPKMNLNHFDVYRISDEEELFEIGFEEYLYAGELCVIEWADLIPNLLPEHTKWVRLERAGNNPQVRKITMEGMEE